MSNTGVHPINNTYRKRSLNLEAGELFEDLLPESSSGEAESLHSSNITPQAFGRVAKVDNVLLNEKEIRKSSEDTLTKFQTLRLQLTTITLSIGLLAFVITYVHGTYAAEKSSQQGLQLSSLLKTEASTILTILRASQGLLSMLTTLALDGTFVLLQSSTMALPHGLSYLTLLSLSPSTNALELVGIIVSGTAPARTKSVAFLR